MLRPYVQHMKGDPDGAAKAWVALGCPYEQAIALLDLSDTAATSEALELVEELGATPRTTQSVGSSSCPPRPWGTTSRRSCSDSVQNHAPRQCSSLGSGGFSPATVDSPPALTTSRLRSAQGLAAGARLDDHLKRPMRRRQCASACTRYFFTMLTEMLSCCAISA
jgi:hypothetical protein